MARPDLSLHGKAPAQPRPTAGPTSDPNVSPALSAVAWDIRGDLAGDATFVSAAVTRIRHSRPDIARIFFAGRLPDGGRLALGGSDVYRGTVATAVHAMVVEPGVAIADAPVTELTALTDPQQLLGWAGRGVTGHVYVVVLSRPGPVRFSLSPTVQFASDGTPHRIWTPVYTEDGVVVSDLGTEVDPVVTVRADGPGVFKTPEQVRVSGPSPAVAALRVKGTQAASYQGPDPDRLADGLHESVGQLAELGTARLRVLWSGAPWKQRRLALVLVTRPDGLRLQALVGQQGSSEFPAGVRALPRGAPAGCRTCWSRSRPTTRPTCCARPARAPWSTSGRGGRTSRLAVGPTGAVVLVDPGGGAPSASGAVVTLLAPDGHEVLTTTLPEAGTATRSPSSSSLSTEHRVARRPSLRASRAGRTAGSRPPPRRRRRPRRRGSGWPWRRRPGWCRSGRPPPGAGPSAGCVRDDHPGHPDRPADVQRRHRGQLVGQRTQPARRAGVPAPPAHARGRGERVDEARQHPRRGHRQQGEADQADRAGEDQGVPDPAVVAAARR